MKHQWLAVLAFACLTEWSFGQGGIQFVKPVRENLRLSPNGKQIAEMLSGTRVEILERSGDWVRVQVEGWIWSKSLVDDPTMVENFSVRASHILLETREEANRILGLLNAGASFEELAKKHSIDPASGSAGGDLGHFTRGDLRPEFEKALFSLQVGGITGVIQTEAGFHIIKRTE
ncbi:MAG TPA: hypothetical protein ENN03_02575 [bacterium]|nr:hypothetical protein [bacterium]